MITTKGIFVKLGKGRKLFSRVTTKDVDASIKVEIPKHRVVKGPVVSTNKLADVADIGKKKKRDDIMAERKLAVKDEKKIVIEKKAVPIIKMDNQDFLMNTGSEPIKEVIEAVKSNVKKAVRLEVNKKPWKEMTDDEKKAAYQERAKKAKATREAKAEKKKEGKK